MFVFSHTIYNNARNALLIIRYFLDISETFRCV